LVNQDPFKDEYQELLTYSELTYSRVSDYYFVDGMALVKSKEGEKYGFINQKYELKIPLIYDMAQHFQNGRALVAKGANIGYINTQGEEIIPCIYRAIREFKDGFYPAYLNGKGWGYLNWNGDVAIPFAYRDALPFVEGLAAVEDTRRYWGFIDAKDKVKISFKFEAVKSFAGGIAAVKINDLWGFIDKSGNWLIKPQYVQVLDSDFSKGKAQVRANGKTFFINQQGEIVNH
jgi:hypothetical protein